MQRFFFNIPLSKNGLSKYSFREFKVSFRHSMDFFIAILIFLSTNLFLIFFHFLSRNKQKIETYSTMPNN